MKYPAAVKQIAPKTVELQVQLTERHVSTPPPPGCARPGGASARRARAACAACAVLRRTPSEADTAEGVLATPGVYQGFRDATAVMAHPGLAVCGRLHGPWRGPGLPISLQGAMAACAHARGAAHHAPARQILRRDSGRSPIL